MSELSELRTKVDKISENVSKMCGMLEAKLPGLATREEVTTKILEHCTSPVHKKRSYPPGPITEHSTKRRVAEIGAIVALTSVLWQIGKFLTTLFTQ